MSKEFSQRPILHSSFARSIYDRMIREEQLRKFDRNKWYDCDQSKLSDELQLKFMKFSAEDLETEAFIETCYNKSEWFFTHLFHSIARTILCIFMTSTSVNGLLDRGSMFIFSKSQFSSFFENLPQLQDQSSSLLDLGAGDGRVTDVISDGFANTYVTEMSPVMKRILTRKGYKLLDVDLARHDEDLKYDLISCLNLLDRCDKPLTMLQTIKKKLKPNGYILLALVLPFSQYVESSKNAHKPSEILPISGKTLEEQLVSFDEKIAQPNGFEIVKWTKLPYLCEGDMQLSFYWLNDVVMLMRPSN